MLRPQPEPDKYIVEQILGGRAVAKKKAKKVAKKAAKKVAKKAAKKAKK
jgi:hypothetical protein